MMVTAETASSVSLFQIRGAAAEKALSLRVDSWHHQAVTV